MWDVFACVNLESHHCRNAEYWAAEERPTVQQYDWTKVRARWAWQ